MTSLSILDKSHIEEKHLAVYNEILQEARDVHASVVGGFKTPDFVDNQIVERLRLESTRLGSQFREQNRKFLQSFERYDVVLVNGGDPVIANFALKTNPLVLAKLRELLRSGRVRFFLSIRLFQLRYRFCNSNQLLLLVFWNSSVALL